MLCIHSEKHNLFINQTMRRDSFLNIEIKSPSVEIVEADLNLPEHQRAVVELIDAYAGDPMGNGRPLADEVRRALIPGLQQHPTTVIFLAYAGEKAIGIAVCFLGFSTFAARPLINIHDLAVLPAHRGQGIGRLLLDEVGRKARDLGCCKLTLEVLENNHTAKRLYESAGFAQAAYQQEAGGALFYSKPLMEKQEMN
jgi:ribosomal protein S18 acetylase RimI-like enzyme